MLDKQTIVTMSKGNPGAMRFLLEMDHSGIAASLIQK